MPSLNTLRNKKEENKAFSKIKQTMRLGIKGMIKKGREMQAKKARESIEDFKRDETITSIEVETNPYGFPFG